jgi:hypothetical protein
MPGWLPTEIELLADTWAADWAISRLRPWEEGGVKVASFMVDGFEDYARVLHPAGGRGGESRGLRWSEVAFRLSKPFQPDVQFRHLAGDSDLYHHPILGDIEPLSGSLPIGLLRSLVTLFQRWSEEGERCWFAMWDGNGTWWKGAHSGEDPFDDERDAVLRRTPLVHTQHRDYFLMRGPLPAVLPLFDAAGSQSPALWWPEGRSWLVSTEVDAYSTYVGGSAYLIEDLLRSDEIEAVPSSLDALLDWGL